MTKKTIFFCLLVAVLIGAMSVGFSSCSKEDKKEEKISVDPILDKWIEFRSYTNYIKFNFDNTYSLDLGNGIVKGLYRIIESEKTTYSSTSQYLNPDGTIYEETTTFDANLYKMLVSGSDVFDRIWVYYFRPHIDNPTFYQLVVHFYNDNELIDTKGYMRE
jgi:hypothetical protein